MPEAEHNPACAQLYFYDSDDALRYRMQQNDDLNCDTMRYLQHMLLDINRYKPLLCHAFEILQTIRLLDARKGLFLGLSQHLTCL